MRGIGLPNLGTRRRGLRLRARQDQREQQNKGPGSATRHELLLGPYSKPWSYGLAVATVRLSTQKL
jgi:hypothetical protein